MGAVYDDNLTGQIEVALQIITTCCKVSGPQKAALIEAIRDVLLSHRCIQQNGQEDGHTYSVVLNWRGGRLISQARHYQCGRGEESECNFLRLYCDLDTGELLEEPETPIGEFGYNLNEHWEDGQK